MGLRNLRLVLSSCLAPYSKRYIVIPESREYMLTQSQIVILFWGQHKAKRLGALPDYGTSSKPTWSARTKDFIVETDAIGLFLLAATLALIFCTYIYAVWNCLSTSY